MPSPKPTPRTIDEYLARVSPEQLAALEQLRRRIHAAAPAAEESISYGLPAFRCDGRPLVAFGAAARHCALYPMSTAVMAAFQADLAAFDTSKGTIRFAAQQPLPAALVRRLVKARLAEIATPARPPGKAPATRRTRTARRTRATDAATSEDAGSRSARLAANACTHDASSVLAALKQLSDPRFRRELSSRYGIDAPNALGVPMRALQKLAKGLGRNQALAVALWQTGQYEARTVAAFVAEPARVTPALMDRWCDDFDNWAICDTVCFHLFDRTPHAFTKIAEWADRREEFPRRAAFALLACVALHDDHAADPAFIRCLPLLEKAALDERNFVKKAVSWALRAVGTRNAALRTAATTLARRLAAAPESGPRWVGKDALRALQKPARPQRGS